MPMPNVYKVSKVGRTPNGFAYVRYNNVPDIHVVNPKSMPQRIQDAFDQLGKVVRYKCEQLHKAGMDARTACLTVAKDYNEISV